MIKNLNKINPIKKHILLKFLARVDSCNKIEKVIDKIIVFGSAIRNDCAEESDIDICIFSDFTIFNKNYSRAINGPGEENFDVIRYTYASKNLKNTINTYGVCVYE